MKIGIKVYYTCSLHNGHSLALLNPICEPVQEDEGEVYFVQGKEMGLVTNR